MDEAGLGVGVGPEPTNNAEAEDEVGCTEADAAGPDDPDEVEAEVSCAAMLCCTLAIISPMAAELTSLITRMALFAPAVSST